MTTLVVIIRVICCVMSEGISLFIRRRLCTLQMTQGELASQAGISRQALVKILAGDVRDPRIRTVIALARVLQTSPFDLLRHWLASSGERGALTWQDRQGDRISFVGHENWPNGSIFAPGEEIEKCWRIQNTGNEAWRGREMRCLTLTDQTMPGLVPVTNAVPLPEIAAGEYHTFAMQFICPAIPGLFASFWKMTYADGAFCFPELPPLECVVTVVSF